LVAEILAFEKMKSVSLPQQQSVAIPTRLIQSYQAIMLGSMIYSSIPATNEI